MLHYHDRCRQAFGKTAKTTLSALSPPAEAAIAMMSNAALLDRDKPSISSLMAFTSLKFINQVDKMIFQSWNDQIR